MKCGFNQILMYIIDVILYLHNECIEKNQFELCSKYDREHDFDVILGSVIPCCKLRWMCCKHSNDVTQQVETPDKSTIFVVSDKGHDFHVMWRLHYTTTVKHIDVTMDRLSVQQPMNCCDMLHQVVLNLYSIL